MKLLALILLLIAAPVYGYGPYDGDVVKVIDGDTIKIDLRLYPGLTKRVNVRLDGVNTPETRTKLACEKALGLEAKQYTQAFLNMDSGRVKVSNVKNGKYAGRVLGNVSVDDKSLEFALIMSGLAREYHGGKREPWCKENE